jgi:hypothetical protein
LSRLIVERQDPLVDLALVHRKVLEMVLEMVPEMSHTHRSRLHRKRQSRNLIEMKTVHSPALLLRPTNHLT